MNEYTYIVQSDDDEAASSGSEWSPVKSKGNVIHETGTKENPIDLVSEDEEEEEEVIPGTPDTIPYPLSKRKYENCGKKGKRRRRSLCAESSKLGPRRLSFSGAEVENTPDYVIEPVGTFDLPGQDQLMMNMTASELGICFV